MQNTRRKLIFAFKMAVTAALVFLFYRRITVDQLTSVLFNINLIWLPLLFLVLLLNSFISTVKWHIFLKASGLKTNLGRLFRTYLGAGFLNLFMPSNVGGDFYRIYDTGVKTSDAARSTASVLADRITGFLAIVIFGLAASVAGAGRIKEPMLIVVPIAVFSALALLIALLYQQKILRKLLSITGLSKFRVIEKQTDNFLTAFQEYRKSPGLFTKVMAISFSFQFMVIVFVFLMAKSLDINAPFPLFCMFVPLISLLEAVPVTMYGVGFREAGYLIFMHSAGGTDQDALSLSLLYVILSLLYSSLGGIVLLFRHGAYRNRMDQNR